MKVIGKGDELQKADCVVKLDGNPVQEFSNSILDDQMISWIPVTAGQKITIEAGCNVTAGEVVSDLIIDGIVRSTMSTSSKKADWEKYKRFSHKFNTASHMWDGKVTDVDLVVKDLPEDVQLGEQKDDAAADTHGTIEVRIWVLEHEKQERANQKYPVFESCDNWRELEGDAPTYSVVQPTQELDCVSNDFNPLGSAKVTLARKRMTAARPGEKPWASFKFFYRTQEAINLAGMSMAPKTNKKNTLRWAPPAVKLADEDEARDQAATEAQDPPEVTQPDLGSLTEVPDLSLPAQTTTTATKDDLAPATDLPPPTIENTLDPNALGSEKKSTPAEHTVVEKDIDSAQGHHDTMPPKRKGNRSSTAEPVAEPKSSVLDIQDPSSIPDRDNAIKEYEAKVAPLSQFDDIATNAILKNDMKDNAQKIEEVATTNTDLETPESAKVFKKESSILASVEEEVAPSSPATPSPLPLTAASLDTSAMRKRKAASMTPETAGKKACNKLEAEVAAIRKKIAERNAIKIAALKKQEDADAQKQAQLERTLAALQEELEDIDEVIAGAEMGYEETMSSIAASQREDSAVAE